MSKLQTEYFVEVGWMRDEGGQSTKQVGQQVASAAAATTSNKLAAVHAQLELHKATANSPI